MLASSQRVASVRSRAFKPADGPIGPRASRPIRSVRTNATATETASLSAFKTSGKDVVSFLKLSGKDKQDPELVEGALVALEQASASKTKTGLDTVPGRWRLVFSTSTSIRMWQYIPVKEDLVVDVATRAISLESELGPFQFDIQGTIFSWDEAGGALTFQFDRGVAIKLGGRTVWTVTPKNTKPKTYTFFYVDSDISGARSSAGGLSLLVRNP